MLKQVLIFLFASLSFCNVMAQAKPCTELSKYIKKVDTSKPFLLEGVYCLESEKDTVAENGIGFVRFHVFNRMDGKVMNEGLVWFDRETKFKFENGSVLATIPTGKYVVSVYPLEPHYPFSIGNFRAKAGKVITLNCFIGHRLDY